MISDINADQTKCKECGISFDTTEGLEQHYELEHKWKNNKISKVKFFLFHIKFIIVVC